MKPEKVHLFMFMGQSNMAGRGEAEKAPIVKENMGYEFRAITSPDRLFQIKEPFGKDENYINGVYEPDMKTGSLVSAFVNAYTDMTRIPIVGVSCSKGGSAISEWIEGLAYYKDAVHRNRLCEEYLRDNDIKIVRRFMVWCQGCTDGDLHTDSKVYEKFTENMLHSFMKKCNIETCFLIQIGNKRSEPELYLPIQKAQQNIAEKHKDIVIVSRSFEKLKEFMKDEFHYHQEGYNIVGEEAGKNAGNYVIRTATGL